MMGQQKRKNKDLDNNPLTVENKLDPRQRLCWNLYIDQKSETFANGRKSAIKAGYGKHYADVITMQPWFKDKARRTHLLGKAEKKIDKILDMDYLDEKGEIRADVLRVQADTAKHITKTLGKDEGYSEKTEVENTGNTTVFLPQELLEKFNLTEKK